MANLSRLDPRIERTRALLRETLMALIVERGDYSAITIRDIVERAEVARTTFYLHFKTIDDLLFETMADVYATIVQSMHTSSGNARLRQMDFSAAQDFEHVQQYAAFYRVILSDKGSLAFVNRVRRFLAELIQRELAAELPNLSQQELAMRAWFMAGAQIGLIVWWLESDMALSPNTISSGAGRLCELGMLGAGQVLPTDGQSVP